MENYNNVPKERVFPEGEVQIERETKLLFIRLNRKYSEFVVSRILFCAEIGRASCRERV